MQFFYFIYLWLNLVESVNVLLQAVTFHKNPGDVKFSVN